MNKKYFPGNNLSNVSRVTWVEMNKKYFPGNNLSNVSRGTYTYFF